MRIMELINPQIDPVEVCKGEEAVEEEEEEEDDIYPGILDQSQVRTFIEVYIVVFSLFLLWSGLRTSCNEESKKNCAKFHS